MEGLPSIVAAGATWFLMPDSAETAKFLNEEEKAIAKARSIRQVGGDQDIRISGVNWHHVGITLLDYKVHIFS